VTNRHKKWLQAYAEERNNVEEEKEKERERGKREERRLREKSQKMREEIRRIRGSEGEEEGEEEKVQQITAVLAKLPGNRNMKQLTTESSFSQSNPLSSRTSNSSDDSASHSSSSSSSSSHSNNNVSNSTSTSRHRLGSLKPGWARTATEQSSHLDHEADELIDFASNLDYNSYINDVEVREAIRFVQERVDNLQTEQEKEQEKEEKRRKEMEKAKEREERKEAEEWEEVWEPDEEGKLDENGQILMKKVKRRRFKVQQSNPFASSSSSSSSSSSFLSSSQSDSSSNLDPALSTLSRSVLESNDQVRHIHSNASVRSIMESEKEKELVLTIPGGNKIPGRGESWISGDGSTDEKSNSLDLSLNPPLITVTHEKATLPASTPNKTVDPNNLPFLYRHPAV